MYTVEIYLYVKNNNPIKAINQNQCHYTRVYIVYITYNPKARIYTRIF